MNRFRTSAIIAGLAAILSAGVLGFAAPASAASSAGSVTIENSSNLSVATSQALRVVATAAAAACSSPIAMTRPVVLTISGPSGNASTQTIVSTAVACSKGTTLQESIATPRLNGAYTVTMQNGSAANTASATLDVAVPPSRVQGLTVTTAGTVATFDWVADSEPDILSYDVLNSAGAIVSSTDPADACGASSSCSVPVDLGSAAAGHSESFRMQAIRNGANGTTVSGPMSSAATASFAAAPTPSPTATSPSSTGPSPDPSSTTSSDPTTGTGTSTGGGQSAGTGGSATSPTTGKGKAKAGKSHLPAVTAASIPTLDTPTLPGVQTETKPLALGKPGGKLAYPAPRVATQQRISAAHTITHDITRGLRLPPLWRGIAAAAVLLLLAVHLRAWASRTDLV